MRDHVLENLQDDLRSLDLATLRPDRQVLKHGTSIGPELMMPSQTNPSANFVALCVSLMFFFHTLYLLALFVP